MNKNLHELIQISRKYGSDSKWVAAGGGNTSLKSGGALYVKASGYSLGTIDENGFTKMDRVRLASIWQKSYPTAQNPESVKEREALVLTDMMNARMPGENLRPSVETLVHDILPWPLIVHLHPTLVNGLCCSRNGPQIVEKIFGNKAMWIPVIDPGFVLAKEIRFRLVSRTHDSGTNGNHENPDYIFLANHGIFVGGADSHEVDQKYQLLQEKLLERVRHPLQAMPQEINTAQIFDKIPGNISDWQSTATNLFGPDARITFLQSGELNRCQNNSPLSEHLLSCLTPDHIVYSGPGAMQLKKPSPEDWQAASAQYQKKWNTPPVVTLLSLPNGEIATLATASNPKALANALLLFKSALEITAYAENFGGPVFLQEAFVRFILDWEVEHYRSKISGVN